MKKRQKAEEKERLKQEKAKKIAEKEAAEKAAKQQAEEVRCPFSLGQESEVDIVCTNRTTRPTATASSRSTTHPSERVRPVVLSAFARPLTRFNATGAKREKFENISAASEGQTVLVRARLQTSRAQGAFHSFFLPHVRSALT